MNTEAKPTVRKDALVATVAVGALGLLWIFFRLYWQGVLLMLAASAVGYLGVLRPRKLAPVGGGDPVPEPAPRRAKPDKPRRSKKRGRRK